MLSYDDPAGHAVVCDLCSCGEFCHDFFVFIIMKSVKMHSKSQTLLLNTTRTRERRTNWIIDQYLFKQQYPTIIT